MGCRWHPEESSSSTMWSTKAVARAKVRSSYSWVFPTGMILSRVSSSASNGRKDGIQFESLTGVVGSEGLPLVNTVAPPVFLKDTEDLGADGQWGLGQNGLSKSNRGVTQEPCGGSRGSFEDRYVQELA